MDEKFKILVGIELNTSDIQEQLKKYKFPNLKMEMDTKNVTDSIEKINKAYTDLQNNIKKVTEEQKKLNSLMENSNKNFKEFFQNQNNRDKSYDNSIKDNLKQKRNGNNSENNNQRYKEANTLLNQQLLAYENIWKIKKEISNLNPNNNEEISVLQKKKEMYQDEYSKIQKKLNSYSDIINNEQKLNSLLDIQKRIKLDIEQVKAHKSDNEKIDLELKANNIRDIISSSKISKQFNLLNDDYSFLEKENLITQNLKKDFIELQQLQNKLNSSTSSKDLVSNYEKFEQVLKKVKNQIDIINNNQKSINIKELFKSNINKELAEFNNYRNKIESTLQIDDNVEERFNNLFNSLNNVSSDTELKKWKNELKALKSDIIEIERLQKQQSLLDAGVKKERIQAANTALKNQEDCLRNIGKLERETIIKDDGKHQNELALIRQELEAEKQKYQQLENISKEYEDIISKEERLAAISEIEKENKSTNNLELSRSKDKSLNQALLSQNLSYQKENLKSNIDKFLSENTKLNKMSDTARQLKGDFESLYNSIDAISDTKSLQGLKTQLSTLKNKVAQAGLLGEISTEELFKSNINKELAEFDNYRKSIESTLQLTDGIEERFNNLFNSLNNVSSDTELKKWKNELKALKSDIIEIERLQKQQSLLDAGVKKERIQAANTTLKNQEDCLRNIGKLERETIIKDDGKHQNELALIRQELEAEKQKYQQLENISKEYEDIISKEERLAAISEIEKENKRINDLEKARNEDKIIQQSIVPQNLEYQKDHLRSRIDKFLSENTKLNSMSEKAKELKSEFEALYKAIDNIDNTKSLSGLSTKFNTLVNDVKAAGLSGRSYIEEIKKDFSKLFNFLSISTMMFQIFDKAKQSLTELKEVDSILTEISKTSNLTTKQIKELGVTAFDSASKYGQTASNYLTGVQEMYRSGYNNAEQLAEISILAQAAGDMTADLANDYLIASDAAYGYSGNVEKLTALLDSQNQVTNRNAVSMEELANATKVAANQLSNANIAENEMTALLGTGIATSREAGETVGRAVKGIIMNLQQVEGETGFEDEIIDADALEKVEARCHSVGVELEYMENGIAKLRNPIQVLKELAEVYNSLPDDSADKAGIISDIGGKYRGNILSSILSNWVNKLFTKIYKYL